MPWVYKGKVIREQWPWSTDEGIKHPPNWGIWSDEEKRAQGLVWKDFKISGNIEQKTEE